MGTGLMPILTSPLIRVIQMTKLPAMCRVSTDKCLLPPRFMYRDINLVTLLPEFQPEADACTIATLSPVGNVTIPKYAAAILRIPEDTPHKDIEDLLKIRGHTLLLTQLDEMVARTDLKMSTKMLTNGHANFCFLENRDGSVSMAFVRYLYRDGWYAKKLLRFDDGNFLNVSHRILVSNLDISIPGAL